MLSPRRPGHGAPRPRGPVLARRGAFAFLAAGLILVSCDSAPPALRVGPVSYTVEDLGALGPTQQRTLAELTAFGLAVAEGRTDELIEPYVDRELRSIVLQKLAMEMAVRESGFGDAGLRAAYARDPEYELVVRHLVVLSERWRPAEHRDSAAARAREALARARAGEDFAALAAEYSDEPGAAERGGLLEPGREGSWVPEFWTAASSLGKGKLSDVVETEYGFHVMRLEDRSPIPFGEVRDRVVERVVDLPEALGQASEWAAGRMDAARMDTAALLAWRSRTYGDPAAIPAGGPAATAPVAGDPADTATPATPLVHWPGDSIPAYTTSDLERYILPLPPEATAVVREGEPAELARFVRAAARNALMHERAREAGLEPSAAQKAALERSWRDRVVGWATALGFAEDQSRREVREAALSALGSTRQEAMVARAELERLAGGLRAMYPAERPPQDAVE